MTENTVQVPVVTIEDVESYIAQASHTIIDVNSSEKYESGHIPGALHVDKTKLEEQLPQDTATPLVFYCGGPSCMAAPNAAKVASSLGYENVAVLSAGISGWQEAGKPTDVVA